MTGVPEVDAYSRFLRARPVVMPILALRLERHALARLEAWWQAFTRDRRLRGARIAVCHHDLCHHNLLRSEAGHLSGVLDMAISR